MKVRIAEKLPLHSLTIHSDRDLYIADYKNVRNGDVEISGVPFVDIKYVHLSNEMPVTICFDGFKENCLPIKKGHYNKQCECALFPDRCKPEDWVLFIETKYAANYQVAFDEEIDYPNGMVDQIIRTVDFFRGKDILSKDKIVHALVSFPNLVEEFNSTIFKGDLSIEDILFDHKIIIRGTNRARIIDEMDCELISE